MKKQKAKVKPVTRCPKCQGIVRPVFSNRLAKRQTYGVCDNCHTLYAWDGRTWISTIRKRKFSENRENNMKG